MPGIFRQKALSKLADPEKLDQMFTVTSLRAWILLSTLIVIFVIAILWSIFGTVPTRIEAQGIILSHNAYIYDATANDTGRVYEILVSPGQRVKKNQLLVKLTNVLLEEQVRNQKIQLQELRTEYIKRKQFIIQDNVSESKQQQELRKSLKQSIEDSKKYLTSVDAAIAKRQEAVREGVISEQQNQDYLRDYYRAKQDYNAFMQKVLESNITERRTIRQNNEKLAEFELKMSNEEHQFKELNDKYILATEIHSPIDGQVIELGVKQGDLVNAGKITVHIEEYAQQLDAVLFIPPSQGKLIQLGMEAQVVPSTVKREEYGAIQATVVNVSSFPMTKEGILTIVGNEKLVDAFSEKGSPLYIRVDLKDNPATFSKLKWISSNGPKLEITNGTLCAATITIKKQAPITLIVPAFKQFFGIGE